MSGAPHDILCLGELAALQSLSWCTFWHVEVVRVWPRGSSVW